MEVTLLKVEGIGKLKGVARVNETIVAEGNRFFSDKRGGRRLSNGEVKILEQAPVCQSELLLILT